MSQRRQRVMDWAELVGLVCIMIAVAVFMVVVVRGLVAAL